jgi:DNA-binding beta-propeller fold protein YncE/plastocyanin
VSVRRQRGVVTVAVLAAAAAGFAGFAAAGVGTGSSPTTRITVGVKEWEFDLSQDTAPVGTVVFTVTNTGQTEPHDFAINGQTSAVLMPGQSTTLTTTFTRPGMYGYLDTRADTDRDMYGTFTVTGTAVTETTATTPSTTTVAPPTTATPASLPLRRLADVPLPGGATRFDYQSIDTGRRRLFIAHLGGGDVVVFDLGHRRVVGDIRGVAGAHGVLVVPKLRRLYAAATGDAQLVTIDEHSLQTLRRAPAGDYPDGIAYDSRDGLVFVSDESGDQETVFGARSGRRVGAVPLPGDAGNVQYDNVSARILVAVGARDELALIEPRSRRVVGHAALPGCEHPHGLHLDVARRLAFVACDRNAKLLLVDLKTMRVRQTESVGDEPDVLDFDPGLRRLYVACESGVVSVFAERRRRLVKIGQATLAEHAHTVAVDARTHLVYFPLEDVEGKPVLRIMRPA